MVDKQYRDEYTFKSSQSELIEVKSMEKLSREECLLDAWVSLSGILKNSRITKGLLYNESIVMLMAYRKYQENENQKISVKEIVHKTKMQKSLVNRTINALIEKGMLVKCESTGDKRMQYVACVKEKLEDFLKVHNTSLALVEDIISIIGEEDSDRFISMTNKIVNSGYEI